MSCIKVVSRTAPAYQVPEDNSASRSRGTARDPRPQRSLGVELSHWLTLVIERPISIMIEIVLIGWSEQSQKLDTRYSESGIGHDGISA
jgi:hypothetical protein